MSSLHAVVVGGSLGGLMTAAVLRRDGHQVTVLERNPRPLEDQGAGIRVQPAMLRFLEEVLGREGADIATTIMTRRYLDADGAVVHEVDEPGACTHWGRLFATLQSADLGDYRLGSPVIGFSQDADGVRVRLADDSRLGADLLVFADGTGSTGRRRLYPEVRPQYVGYVAWRGAVPESELPRSLVDACARSLVICIIPGSHIHVYPVPGESGSTRPGERLLNFVWYRNVDEQAELDELLTDRQGRAHDLSLRHDALRESVVASVKRDARASLPSGVAELVTRSDVFVQAVVELSVPQMAHGRVALLGDAAFVARPHAGAGTAKAADNALGLARSLGDSSGGVVDALRSWEVTELARGHDLLQRSAAIGELYQREGTYPGDPRLEELASTVSWIQ